MMTWFLVFFISSHDWGYSTNYAIGLLRWKDSLFDSNGKTSLKRLRGSWPKGKRVGRTFSYNV